MSDAPVAITVNEQLTYQPDTGQSAAIMARLASRLNELDERVRELSRRETSPTAVAATANTVVLRDGSAGATFAALAATTITTSSDVSVAGSLVALTGVKVPRSSGTAVFAVDASGTGSGISLANNATVQPFGASNNFGGFFAINETAVNGGTGLFLVGAIAPSVAGVTKIVDPMNLFTVNAAGTASKINVYLSGSIVTIENKYGSTVGLSVAVLMRTRTNT